LLEWSSQSDESEKTLANIKMESSCLNILFTNSKREAILMLGKEESIQTASMLHDVVFQHQRQIIKRNNENKMHLQILLEKKNTLSTQSSLQFTIFTDVLKFLQQNQVSLNLVY
jgi:hypothetical protein